MVSGGHLGELPDWVAIFQAAEKLDVSPMQLAGFDYKPNEIPIVWITWSLQYMRVELEAKAQLIRQARGGHTANTLGT